MYHAEPFSTVQSRASSFLPLSALTLYSLLPEAFKTEVVILFYIKMGSRQGTHFVLQELLHKSPCILYLHFDSSSLTNLFELVVVVVFSSILQYENIK